jgi:NADH-quinone oxidoreductase subunit M
MTPAGLLNIAIVLPLLGAALIGGGASLGRTYVRQVALLFTLATLVLAAALIAQFPANGVLTNGFAVTQIPWLGDLPGFEVRYSVGLDGLGV